MIWVLNYLDDLESDFSAFHRVDDIRRMPGPRFFRMASRLVAYDGVLRNRLVAEMEDDKKSNRRLGPGYSGTRFQNEKSDLSAMKFSNPDLFEHKEV